MVDKEKTATEMFLERMRPRAAQPISSSVPQPPSLLEQLRAQRDRLQPPQFTPPPVQPPQFAPPPPPLPSPQPRPMYQFSNFAHAEIGSPSYPGLGDGFEGVCKIEKTYTKETSYGPAFFCEMTVMQSNLLAHPVGQYVVWKQNMKNHDVAEHAILQWAAAAVMLRGPVEELRAQLRVPIAAATTNSVTNPFSQRIVVVRVHNIVTAKGYPFSVHDFFSVDAPDKKPFERVFKNLNAETIRTDNGSIPLKNFSCASGSVECVFKNLEARLITEIRKHDYVFGCVAWLTHFDILSALASRKKVCIVVQKEDFLRPDGGGGPSKDTLRQLYGKLPGYEKWSFRRDPRRVENALELVDELNTAHDPHVDAVRCCGIGGNERDRPRCHHKFVVFGDWIEDEGVEGFLPSVVWTGSFNFTLNAVNSFENAVLIHDPIIARAYLREFEQIVALSEPLNWEASHVEPSYRIGT